MVFENLPIQLDARGNATLSSGRGDPYAYAQAPAPAPAEHRGGQIRRVEFDPVARVAGGLAFHTAVDLERGEVLEAASMATLFRGYEVILQGRDARDAIFISSRACGVCGGVHPTCSSLAVEMALGIQAPPMGIVARNLLVAMEYLYDHPVALFTRAGPDFSEPTVRETNPELWERAQQTTAPGRETHGFARISDIMTAMTRFNGMLHEESLQMSRVAREGYVLLGGKYPHPETISLGGISSGVDRQDLNLVMLRIVPFLDYSKKVVAIWDDIVNFFYQADPRFGEVGAAPKNFIDLGQWDDPYAYDGTFENSPVWGERRWATPGAIVNGELRTTDLQQINMGVEEFVEHSFYEDWTGNGSYRFPTDPVGNPLSPYHPWNKDTLPQPGATSWPKYSWSTAPRWDRRPMETGAYARLWTTAMANSVPHRRFMDPTGHSLKLSVPQGALPETELEWHLPQSWGALERNRARAYAFAYCAVVAYEQLLLAYDLMRKGGPDAKVHTPYKIPKDSRMGVGFWGGGRGYLSHHIELDNRMIENYQILGPSTFVASPMDPFGNRGPLEDAVVATPLLSSQQPERCIDVLRTIRSFDPCMTCTTH